MSTPCKRAQGIGFSVSALLGQSVLGRLSAVTQNLTFSTSVSSSGPAVSPDLVHACISASTMARRSGRHNKSSAVVQVHCTARSDKLREILFYADALGSDQSGLSSVFMYRENHLPAGLQRAGDAARDVDEDDLPIAELTGC